MKPLLPLLFILLFIPALASANQDSNCEMPYKPTNLLKLLFYYNKTMTYIASATDPCHTRFTEEVKRVVHSSILLTEGCREATLKDIDEALKKALTLGKSQAG